MTDLFGNFSAIIDDIMWLFKKIGRGIKKVFSFMSGGKGFSRGGKWEDGSDNKDDLE